MTWRIRRRVRPASRAVLLCVAAVLVASCGSSTADTAGRSRPVVTLTVGYNTVLSSSSGTWAAVPMGILSQPLNTFWELFYRPTGAAKWRLVTPPGVALNGGLVLSEVAPGPMTVGIEPTNLLKYSPLAQRRVSGGSWSPGLVPGALAAAPGALASSAGTKMLAVVRDGGGEIVASSGDVVNWTSVVTEHQLASSAGGSCGLTALGSVAFSWHGTVLAGGACSDPGVVGVFALTTSSWALIGPRLGGVLASKPATVLRLWSAPSGSGAPVAGLVAAGGASSSNLVAIWNRGVPTSWTVSPPLPVSAGSRLLSTALAPGGEVVALVAPPKGGPDLETVRSGGSWHRLGSLPTGTATVAVSSDGTVDALAVTGESLFTDWRLNTGTGSWDRLQAMRVSVPIGSSS
jgi:hypothetical protein